MFCSAADIRCTQAIGILQDKMELAFKVQMIRGADCEAVRQFLYCWSFAGNDFVGTGSTGIFRTLPKLNAVVAAQELDFACQAFCFRGAKGINRIVKSVPYWKIGDLDRDPPIA